MFLSYCDTVHVENEAIKTASVMFCSAEVISPSSVVFVYSM